MSFPDFPCNEHICQNSRCVLSTPQLVDCLGGEQRILPDEGIKAVMILPLSLCGGAVLQWRNGSCDILGSLLWLLINMHFLTLHPLLKVPGRKVHKTYMCWICCHVNLVEQTWSDVLPLDMGTRGEWVRESHSVVSDSLWPRGLYSPWNSPGQNTGVGSLSLLQGNLPKPGLKPRSPTLQVDSIPAEPQGKPRVLGDTADKPPAHCWFVNWDGLLVDTVPFSKSSETKLTKQTVLSLSRHCSFMLGAQLNFCLTYSVIYQLLADI